jgi:hypothetical protein
MPDKKLTPMMELIEFLAKDLKMQDFSQLPAYEKANELLEKERQMVVKSYKNGEQNGYLPDMFKLTAEQYYTQTYKS